MGHPVWRWSEGAGEVDGHEGQQEGEQRVAVVGQGALLDDAVERGRRGRR